MRDFLVEGYSGTLSPLILDALETQNEQILRGVQALDCFTEWTHLQGMESIINVLYSKTCTFRHEARDIREDIAENEADLLYSGNYESLEQRAANFETGKVPFTELKSACNELSQRKLLENLEYLERAGYIETDRQVGWDDSFVRLAPRYWDGLIDALISTGREETIFSSSMGTMIAAAAIGELRPIPRSLQAIINAYNARPGGTWTKAELGEKYLEKRLSIRKMENMVRRDAKKNDDIKLIDSDDGRVLTLKQPALRALGQWRTRALARAAELRRSL